MSGASQNFGVRPWVGKPGRLPNPVLPAGILDRERGRPHVVEKLDMTKATAY